jgi:redox-sensing transcriptional repressor
MERANNISMVSIRRLPKYYRYLQELMDRDVFKTSSKELGLIMGFTSSQIRQDLNNFGGFGQQGYGYNVKDLRDSIGEILGIDQEYNIIIIGAGNLGQALANYNNFEKAGFKCIAMFDKNPKMIGLKIRDAEVIDSDRLCSFLREQHVDIAIISTNAEAAQQVTLNATGCGVKTIWNFTNTDIRVPDDVIVENVHIIESLFTLSFLMKNR